MKMVILLLGICGILYGEKLQLTVIRSPADNLLKNAAFANIKQKIPAGWEFRDYSKSENFALQAEKGVFRLETSGNTYGYLQQLQVPVIEGKTYYAEVQIKLNSRALLWLVTSQYDDKLGALQEPKSSTKIYAIANPDHGEELVKELQYFINPAYLVPVSEHIWHRCALEFTVPRGHGIVNYDFRVGAYGGTAGWIEIKEPLFTSATQNLTLILEGENLVKLNVCSMDRSEVQTYSLSPHRERQQISIILKSRLKHYYAEIITESGKLIRRTL